MIRPLLFFFCLSGFFFLTVEARADCDFTAIKNSLYSTESAGSGAYTAVGPQTRYGRPLGKYQFIPPTQASMLARHPECNGSACGGEAILQPACHPVQECIMDKFLEENLARARSDAACQAQLGKTITGSGQGQTMTCQVTESGLLGAMHLGGAGACRNLSNQNADVTGTSVAYYACKHGDNPIPGNCNPAPNPSSIDRMLPAPTLTYGQMQLSNDPLSSMVIDPLLYWWVGGLQKMAQQFTANMAAQVETIGMFLDAKHQLEVQSWFQEKVAEAHKDYQVSEQMCTFGTFSRDLAATQRSADFTKTVLSTEVMQRELGAGDTKAITKGAESLSRIDTYRKKFCEPKDNGKGLDLLCPSPPAPERRNLDIDYTRTIDQPKSLKIDMTDATTTPDEEAVFALIDNLFAHEPLPRIPSDNLELRKYQYHYMNLRSIVAMRGIARNSFANIIALKTASPAQTQGSAPYLKALMVQFGLLPEEIEKLIGENPSYYAQMEILTKTIYQDPIFYTNLYDKPANVDRIRAAMKAIKLMQDRDINAALQRREMLMSMLLELRLRLRTSDVYNSTEETVFDAH